MPSDEPVGIAQAIQVMIELMRQEHRRDVGQSHRTMQFEIGQAPIQCADGGKKQPNLRRPFGIFSINHGRAVVVGLADLDYAHCVTLGDDDGRNAAR